MARVRGRGTGPEPPPLGARRREPPWSRPARATRRTSTLGLFRRVIDRVPRGKVITYGQVAAVAGFPGAARLTVWALHHGEGLPWHRVVAAGGRIALPGGEGLEQRLRLEVEGVRFRGGRVRMDLCAWMPERVGPPRRASPLGSRDREPARRRFPRGP